MKREEGNKTASRGKCKEKAPAKTTWGSSGGEETSAQYEKLGNRDCWKMNLERRGRGILTDWKRLKGNPRGEIRKRKKKRMKSKERTISGTSL